MNSAHKHIEPLESRIVPARIFAVEAGVNQLVSFDSAAPGTLLSDVAITGLMAGEVISGIDFRASDGTLAALGIVDDGATRTARLYQIDPVTGVATQDGTISIGGLADTGSFGFDVNPLTGQVHLVNSSDANHTLSTSSAGSGTSLNDPNQDETVTSLAFDRGFGGIATTLYAYNFQTDELVTIGDIDGSPSNISGGIVKPVAKAKLGGVNFVSGNSVGIGFDIGGDVGAAETGWIGMRQFGTSISKLFNIDLGTAALTEVGTIGDGSRVFSGITLQMDAAGPTISADGKTATWTDIDNDAVTLKITKGTLTESNFRMLAGAGSLQALERLTLADPQFAGTNITITAKRLNGLGDGRVNIGTIDATNLDIGAVTISGDIQRIVAGQSGPGLGLKSLKAASFAGTGFSLIPSNEMQDASRIKSSFGSMAFAGDFGGKLFLDGSDGASLTVGGDFVGGDSQGSASINTTSGRFISKIAVKGDIVGGSGLFSGLIACGVKTLTVGGSLIGGEGGSSGSLSIRSTGVGKIAIGGSTIGGAGNNSGSVTLTDVAQLKIGGGIIGGSGTNSAAVFCQGGTLSMSVKSSIIGGEGFGSASVRANSAGTLLKSLAVGGSIVSTNGDLIIDAIRIGTMKVGGDLAAYGDTGKILLLASGAAAPTTTAESVAIGKLTVGGDVKNAIIGAGLTVTLTGNTPDAAIGSVKIGGSLVASSIVAGIARVSGGFGDADDTLATGNAGNPAIIARIASIAVGGQIIGTAGGAPDSFGIEAEQINVITIGKVKVPLTAAKNDLKLGFTADVRVREL